MKRTILSTAVILTVLAFFAVSCQKDKTPENQVSNKAAKTFYQPPQVDDMNAYLKDFKKKMQTRGNDDTMTPIEAAWHLSSVANYDFGDVVNDYEAFHYDTLRYNINVSNGMVSISDLNALYSTAADDIVSTFEGLCLDNKHIRFIGAEISDDGSVVMSILVSYGYRSYPWYFSDLFAMDSVCSLYFDENTLYSVTDDFPTDLISALNDLTSYHPSGTSGKTFFIMVREKTFLYYEYTDPDHSPFFYDSRIYAKLSLEDYVPHDEICYCLDSYAALGVGNLYSSEVIINWQPLPSITPPDYVPYGVYNHKPTVRYGVPITNEPITPPVD